MPTYWCRECCRNWRPYRGATTVSQCSHSDLRCVLLLNCRLASSAYIVSSVAKVSKYDYVYQGIDETQFGQQQEFVTAMKQWGIIWIWDMASKIEETARWSVFRESECYRSYTHIHIELVGYWLFACYGRTTLAKYMPELRRLLRSGCRHIQVNSVTGSGKSRIVPSVAGEEVWGKLLVLTPSSVDVNGMQQDARLPSCFRMGGGIEGGASFFRSNCQFPYWGRHSVYCSKGRRHRGLGERTYAGYIPDSNARLLDPGLATAAGLCRESVVFNVSTHVHIFIVSRQFSFSHTTLDLSTHHATATVPQIHPCRHSINACWMDSTC